MNKKDLFNKQHPLLKQNRTIGQKYADLLTVKAGSWGFIFSLIVFMIIWIILNTIAFIGQWDPWPFILLNLLLSALAAFQAPIILMSQNRENERDRKKLNYDYLLNRKSEREVEGIKSQLERIERRLERLGGFLKKQRDF